MYENQAIMKPSVPEDATGINDRSNLGSVARLKDCTLLVNQNFGDNQEVNSESDLKNNMVDEFV